MKGFTIFFAFATLIYGCSSQGAPWTEEETKIIHQKLSVLCTYSGINAYKSNHPGYITKFWNSGRRSVNNHKILRIISIFIGVRMNFFQMF